MNEAYIHELLTKYIARKCNKEEYFLIDLWYTRLGNGMYDLNNEHIDLRLSKLDGRIHMIARGIYNKQSPFVMLWHSITLIAALALFIGGSIFYLWHIKQDVSLDHAAPAGTNTRIILEGKTEITLDELSPSDIVNKQNYCIICHKNDGMEYFPVKNSKTHNSQNSINWYW
ncbi:MULTISPECIES: hypothetical protein [unclassified Sphingobacterium]|uniref:hypothetical protein n=1 Tax=unclassified Sphingobacterium TaxID=2609468 RepID=UPI0010476E18|nr:MULTISPECIES: hypothetical protein [unclassified Sphingobacterium]MCS3556137.1 hypothetical protein [Sphingobacterium sp. JUb21]TCR08513.1 hypothetical protein EDF66_10360 [Sphingobacterium sp. JUb20]